MKLNAVKEEIEKVNDELRRMLNTITPDRLRRASLHLLASGKRIRPALVFLSFKTVSRKTAVHETVPIAVALEMVHTASIIHDDIIDKSAKRRTVETVHSKWGADTALLAGNLLFSKALTLIGKQENKRISEVLDRTCERLCEGEQLEISNRGNLDTSEETYLRIIEGKTASLIQACMECGAMLAGGDEEQIKALSEYGYNLGMAFQVTDDIMDIVGGETGKDRGRDIESGTPTVVILHACRTNLGIKKLIEDKEVGEAIEAIKRDSESIEYAEAMAAEYIFRARESLEMFPRSYGKDGLLDIIDSVVGRER